MAALTKIFTSVDFVTSAGTTTTILPNLKHLPEVILTGRANAGKSTLLNAVFARKALVKTSSRPGHTQLLNFFRVNQLQKSFIVVDAPGYGSRGRAEWGELFKKYVKERDELKCLYILFNIQHGITRHDAAMLSWLEASRNPRFLVQPIFTKADTVKSTEGVKAMVDDMRNHLAKVTPSLMPPIVTAVNTSLKVGIDEVRLSMLQATQTHP